MRICLRYWSSGVCSSDLLRDRLLGGACPGQRGVPSRTGASQQPVAQGTSSRSARPEALRRGALQRDKDGLGFEVREDRKSVESGKRIDLGSPRIITRKLS